MPFLINFSCWKCADDGCLGTMVSLLTGLLYASLQLPLDNRENKNSRNVWAKFAQISSCKNFYSYSISKYYWKFVHLHNDFLKNNLRTLRGISASRNIADRVQRIETPKSTDRKKNWPSTFLIIKKSLKKMVKMPKICGLNRLVSCLYSFK